jgi:diguanylate cyclase (GGDEF)-like protein
MFNLDVGKILDFITRATLNAYNVQFFEKLSRSLSVSLDMEHVFIALIDEEHLSAKTIAYSIGGYESRSDVEYSLSGSPCAYVIANSTTLIGSGFSKEFPDFSLIRNAELNGYIGIALHDDEGRLLGIMSGICVEPMSAEKQQVVRSMFSLFANRIEAELGRIKTLKDLNNLAYLDYLTKLANRHSFETRMNEILEKSILESDRYALIVVDLDRFKQLNDHCGHQAGDLALQQISVKMQSVLGPDDLLARIGGDEFTVIVKKIRTHHAFDIATRLMDEIDSFSFVHEGQVFKLGASMGITSIDPKLGSRDKIFKIADSACYLAKEKGRGRIEIAEMNSVLIDEHIRGSAWPFRIKNALAEERFKLVAQPIKCLQKDDGKTRIEILVRMIGETGEIISPAEFLPPAERFGLITSIDRWVVTNAFEWLNKVKNPRLKININLNTKSFSDEAFKQFLLSTLKKHRCIAPRVVFELTESSAFADPKTAAIFMKQVIAFGSTFALDDFGSGYSNLGVLSTLPLSCVKLDGSFITDLMSNEVKQVIVKSCTQVAHVMKLKVVAEFVENFETVQWLKENGVDFAQGYFYSAPCELRNFEVPDADRNRKIA